MTERPLHTPSWERLLEAAVALQTHFPDAVLVGGTAAALHAQHRVSFDADHVLADLRGKFDAALAELQSIAGWQTARVQRPVQVLGSLDGIETGVRQLIRSAPLETMTLDTQYGALTLPTPPEMLRIKAWLVVRRNATRDYLDVAALSDRLGDEAAVQALSTMDELYPQASGESVLQQIMKQLVAPAPYDLDAVNLREYRALLPRWQDWDAVQAQCATLAMRLADHEASAAD
jgi:hypothetical protein